MQLMIENNLLCAIMPHKIIILESVNHSNTVSYLLTCGYRTTTAQAIAYGTLSDRNATILLAQLVKLLAVS